ncbi:hypothetical protein COX93_01250 [Candidatus Nomurabacteria bacterium CG_4_10_14_0_2_um_filter_30_12]|uniref:Uncharacterized protein n=2 Tax=Candidatus Nomuraibacteriota TaxID=1752729 RepID=A0A2J0MG15_9BACT|nr:MAG: hypothetical protein COU48_02725 [Candidatus Nomurabacteria bacterium CG10_big_fil_rev_8_21_14_0_10_03_31_7]PIZ87336.1 MAG: hypothetical protein COX93_01250 [Candidatus Nomurabacteria bacterium CG_4_10_14_0_2_um_filter_30_12]
MKNYIISIISGALFVSFVTYATVQTKQIEDQKTLATENTNIPSTETPNTNVVSFKNATSDTTTSTTKEINIIPITDSYKNEKDTIYKHENEGKYENEKYDD